MYIYLYIFIYALYINEGFRVGENWVVWNANNMKHFVKMHDPLSCCPYQIQ